MPTECSPGSFDFGTAEGRRIVAAFDGGMVTSDAGVLVLAALSGKLEARRRDCAPLAGKSTLNRLEHAPTGAATRYHKIGHDRRAIERLFVDLFLEAHTAPPRQIVIDLDATDDPLHGHQEGRFFHGYYDCYCYLPLYVFCGRHLLAAKLRRSNIDASAGSVEEIERIVGQIRQTWPRVRIVLRADSGFARERLMAWCEDHRVDYVFGLARNERLEKRIAQALDEARQASQATGKPARVFRDFLWSTRDSWSRRRRVIGKAEWTRGEANPRFVVTSLKPDRWPARTLYEELYCARGDMENRIKECQLDLYADRTTPRPCALTSCASGSRRLPMCSCARCVGSASPIPGSLPPPAARSARSSSKSAPRSASRCAASKSPWPPPAPTPTSSLSSMPEYAPRPPNAAGPNPSR